MLSLSLVLQPGAYSTGAWRMAGNEMERAIDLEWYAGIAQRAEAAGFDAVFHADKLSLPAADWDHLLSPLEPITLLSAIAARTSRIGLVATASTTYSHPFNLARQFATLDHISGGRAAWNVVTTGDQAAQSNFGDTFPDHAARYERAAEFIEVFQSLCLSWDPEAIVIDRESGLQTRKELIRRIEHVGRNFSVAGPLDTPRPPQGYPVLFQAGQSKDGMAVACRLSDVMFGVQNELAASQAFYAQVKSLVASFGRNPDHFVYMPGIITILGSTEEEAGRRHSELVELGGGMENADILSSYLGVDLLKADPDTLIDKERVLAAEAPPATQSWYRTVLGVIEGIDRPTVAEIRRVFETVGRSGHLQVVGTPEHVADTIEAWYRGRAVDGFNLQPVPMPTGADEFFEQVVPILVQRGLFRREYTGTTLRDHLGLPYPT